VRRVLFLALPLALMGGGYRYVSGGQVVSMDGAYVETGKVGISTDVPGIVKEVSVTEDQHVMSARSCTASTIFPFESLSHAPRRRSA
jgi:membrane fusion protein (multidrug efflux system)